MKTNWKSLMILCAVAMVGSVSASAAEKDMEPVHFMGVGIEDIKPEKMDAYMQARIASTKLAAKHGFEFPIMTFVKDFSVTTCWVFQAFAQLDGFPQKMEAWNKKTDGKSMQLEKQAMACVGGATTSLVVYRSDLSYIPEEPSFTPDFTQPFYSHRVVYHIKPGKSEKAQKAASKLKKLNEKKQSPRAYHMYECIIGENTGALIEVMSAKDRETFVKLDENMKKNRAPEIEKILKANADVLTKIETFDGIFVPEASYVPETAFGPTNQGSR